MLRPIEPSDRDALRRGFEELSDDSRYKRFFAPVPHLTPAQLSYLTDVDHRDHEAIVAVSPGGEAMGVARYVRTDPDSGSAEVAVAVSDRFQRRGVATALLDRLVERAREEGVHRFTATALADNADVIDLLERLGSAHMHPPVQGVVEMDIELPVESHDESPLRRVLRSAGEGMLALADRAR